MTKIDKLFEAISRSEGCSLKEADKITGSRNQTYQVVCHLRKHKGHKILRKDDTYTLEEGASVPSTTKAITQLNLSGVKSIPKSMLNKIMTLPPQDRADALDMVKKSVFYALSAAALIQANEFVTKIEEGE